MANNGDLNIEIGAKLSKVERALKELKGDFARASTDLENQSRKTSSGIESNFTNSFRAIGGAIAAAFSVQAITQFAKESVELAARAEGIEAAFNRLNRPNLLSNLRKATRGTVNDVELMRQAVRANNFQVPLEKLATFFEFATKRSAQTGESVDYLVNSIIDGIGRKSTLVLDNLGISAARLQEEVKKVGDFGAAAGNIIAEELGKAGDVATTSAQKMDALRASFENLKKEIGKKLLTEGEGLLSDLPNFLQALTNLVKTGMFNVESGDVADEAFIRGMNDAKKVVDDLVSEGDNYAQGRAFLKLTQDLKKAKEQLNGWKSIKLDDKTPIIAQENYVRALEEAIKTLPKLIEESKKNKEASEGETDAAKDKKKAYEDLIKVQDALFKSSFVTGTRPTSVDSKEGLGFGVEDIIGGDLSDVEDLDAKMTEFFANRTRDFQAASMVAATFGQALNKAFTEGLTNGLNFGDALEKMFKDLAIQMASALLTALALKTVLSALGLGGAVSFGSLFMGQIGLGNTINAQSLANGVNITGSSRQQGTTILNTLNSTSQNTGRWNNNTSG